MNNPKGEPNARLIRVKHTLRAKYIIKKKKMNRYTSLLIYFISISTGSSDGFEQKLISF